MEASGLVKPSGDDLSQEVAARLEEDIVFGRFHPRERLIEQDLAARFSVKRHVVRHALVELERLGLVERTPNRGAVVRLYAAREVDDIYAVRELLETHAATVIRLPLAEAELDRLAGIQRRHAEAVEAGDRQTVFRANLDFHRALFAHCGNEALVEAIEIFAQKSHAYRSILVGDTNYQRWAAEAHRQMVEALRNEDRVGLVALCRDHLSPARDRYIETYRARFD